MASDSCYMLLWTWLLLKPIRSWEIVPEEWINIMDQKLDLWRQCGRTTNCIGQCHHIWAAEKFREHPPIHNPSGVVLGSKINLFSHPSVSSSLQITNRSFTYASPYLWNQLPSSFRQPHSVIHSPPGSPHPAHITSSQSPPSLSSPITASTFHSRLKTHLFQILSSIVTLSPPGLTVLN